MDLINIFNDKKKTDKIIYLKKLEYETYYSSKNKYPYLVIERLSMQTGLPAEGYEKINRSDIEDPFGPDKEIDIKFSFEKEDYTLMMTYGLSPGHNAPAGHHYTTPEIWDETFSYVNICPQEMVFNSGIWVLIENWCKSISKQQKQKNFTNLRVFTGSIPDPKGETKLTLGDKELMVNIPTHMFKVVCARSKNTTDMSKLFMTCFLCPNRQIDPTNIYNQDIINWTVPFSELCKITNIDFEPLLNKYYSYTKQTELVNINELLPIKFYLSPIFDKQMIKSLWYGLMIYAKDLNILETNWKICQNVLANENLEYHKEFYNLVKKKFELQNKKLSIDDEKELEETSSKISYLEDERLLKGNGKLNTKSLFKTNFNFFDLFKKKGNN